MNDGPADRRDLGAELARALGDAARTGARGGRATPPVVVAWSGGLDSTVLLDLVVRDPRVRRAAGGTPVAAHLDHAMRAGSAEDARALARTAADWGVELRSRRLAEPPRSEAEARRLRYAWLEAVAEELGAAEIWTAHHADDQVETVLFRILRGTGVHGLEGIPARREGVARPFLLLEDPVGRAELAAHAAARDLPVRPDPTNATPVATRNRLRHEALPLLEEIVPGTRTALLRLARNAARAAAQIDALAARVLGSDPEAGIPADLWAGADEPLRRSLLRAVARARGVALSEGATSAVLAMPADAQSGRGVDLPGGLRFEREFDRWSLVAQRGTGPAGRDARLEIARPGTSEPEGSGSLDLGGRRLRVAWRRGPPSGPSGSDHVALDLPADAFPLTLRGWREGDRIPLPFGTTPVAKVWAEARVPRRERRRRWVLADRGGEVVAAEGLGPARSRDTIEGSPDDAGAPTIPLLIRLDVDA